MSPAFKDLVLKLIAAPSERLGRAILPLPSKDKELLEMAMRGKGDAADIKEHEWFKDIDWDNIHKEQPPFVPKNWNFEDVDKKEIGKHALVFNALDTVFGLKKPIKDDEKFEHFSDFSYVLTDGEDE